VAFFLLGCALLAGALIAAQVFARADPVLLARIVRYAGAGAAGLLGLLLLFRGQVGLAIPALLGAFAMAQDEVRRRTRGPGARRRSPGQRSGVETRTVRMTLEHDSGRMDGDVLDGPFAGRRLSELSTQELVALREHCVRHDPEAAPLIEAYLDRMRAAGGPGADETGAGAGGPTDGPMSKEEARSLLGVDEAAGPDEIKAAHKRLMRQVHPDQGGTDYLAAKINQAKDVLLGD